MGLISAWLAAAAANKTITFLWRYKWWILGAAGALAMTTYIAVLKLQVDHYRKSADEWADLAERAEAVNAENLKAFHALEAEKRRVEQILGQRIARKAREADQLGGIIQHITSQERSNACAASPAVRALLDRLRAGDGVQEP